MINACAKSGDINGAECWFRQMQSAGIEPNIASYSALIDACAKAAEAERASKWLTHMMNAGHEPEVVSFSSVIDACGKAGDCKQAMSVFERMKVCGVKPTIVTYTSLARPFAQKGCFERVEDIQGWLRAQGLHPNEYFLNILLSAYTHANPPQQSRAEAALREAVGRGVKLNEFILTSLERCVGPERYAELQSELGLGAPKSREAAPKRKFVGRSRAGL